MKKILIAAFAVAAAGCATTPAGPDPSQVQNALNARYVGRPIQEVAAHYGVPHQETTFMGKRVFMWFHTTTKYWSDGPKEYRCTLEVGVNNAGTVEGVGLVGQGGACEFFFP